ncbi:hypothetical protein [Catalinimonas niigatensis]|uniref:hypothetical protein n=1 Tax=Catalinimonas niigatensis TaxID=1397264 RepID=UPI002666A48A|nr:hypothetical protein [Catalinimonas niigatensis]WPP48912.1 hypothetical protein PZB72_19795 [Catalinimonas niigatensis]
MFYPDQHARQSLAIKLGLPIHDHMQDWEYEVSDPKRIGDYLKLYDQSITSDKERESLMEMTLQSLEDLLEEDRLEEFAVYEKLTEERLIKFSELHYKTLNYWSSGNFKVSKYIRNIKKH